MSVFVDTSAFYAYLVANDRAHTAVRQAFARVLRSHVPLRTSSFVVLETMALLQHRLGLGAARDFDESLLPAVTVRWVDEELYRLGVDRLWREDRRQVSLVDAISFELMRTERIATALAVDPHFASAGFKVVPR